MAPTRCAGSCCPTARPSATCRGPRPASRAAWRFVQRLWRLFGQYDAVGDRRGQGARSQAAPDRSPRVAADIEALGFNKAVARIYELTNAIEKAAPSASRTAAIRTHPAARRADDAASRRRGLGRASASQGLIAEAAWPAGRSGAAGRGRGDHRGPGQGQAARYADRRQGPAARGARGACPRQRQGAACARTEPR